MRRCPTRRCRRPRIRAGPCPRGSRSSARTAGVEARAWCPPVIHYRWDVRRGDRAWPGLHGPSWRDLRHAVKRARRARRRNAPQRPRRGQPASIDLAAIDLAAIAKRRKPMPIAHVRGVNINYEVLGTGGPWVALSPGGRRALDNVKSLAQHVADAGYRVLIHDRRNCGLSDIAIGAGRSEYEVWAEDLYDLLSQLKALPAIVGGGSSGCRLSVLFALKYPHAVRALLLWRITGGPFAAARLTENYYGKYIQAAQDGGMAAVCALDHFKERIEARPTNRAVLMHGDRPEDVHCRHGTLARAVRQGRRAADHRRERERFELHQGPDLHHPRQRQDSQPRHRRGRASHDRGQRAARSLPRRPRRRSRPARGLGAQGGRDGRGIHGLPPTRTGQGGLIQPRAKASAADTCPARSNIP